MFGKVVVLMGGIGAEREVSLGSGNGVIAALQASGIEVEGIDAVPGFVDKLIKAKPDRVFIALHGLFGEGGSVQGLLDVLNIPYTGSKLIGSALGMDKVRSKRVWQSLGLPTPPFRVWTSEKDVDTFIDAFGLPLAIKPVFEGSSVGVSKLTNRGDLLAAYELAAQYGEVMIEPWIIGEEYTVGILNNKPLPTINVVASENFYDYAAKYKSDKTQYLCPGAISSKEQAYLQSLALEAFQAIGAVHWGRVDFIRDLNGDFWILEVNTVPGLTTHSLVPKAAAKLGMSYNNVVLEILKHTLTAESNSSIAVISSTQNLNQPHRG